MTSTTMNVEHLTSSNRNFPKKKCGKCIHAAIENRSDSDPGVLGATRSVGQRLILLLALHPHFELHAVGASERSAGKKYKNAVKWKQALLFTERIGNLFLKQCTPDEFKDCDHFRIG
jgi:aspartate-semialdehyde dehydrogenase